LESTLSENKPVRADAPEPSTGGSLLDRLRITRRGIQIALGCIWLLDGLLQFQSYMYSRAFLTQIIEPTAQGQPGFIRVPILALAHFYGHDMTLWNTLAAEIQCAIGLGLIVSRKSVKTALLVSFGWALAVWWFGEGFGGLTSTVLPSPLMGAPGGVILYAVVGLLVWPTSREGGRSPVGPGLLGDRGGLYAWSGLWLLSAALWLVNVNRASEATYEMIKGMAEGSPHWLASFQNSIGNHAQGHGAGIAVALAVISVVVAVGVWMKPLRWPALALGIVVSVVYWVLGQSLGGPFWIGNATDINAAPPFVLLAVALFPVAQGAIPARRVAAEETPAGQARELGAPGVSVS